VRLLVTGSLGQLGRALRARLEQGRCPEEWLDAEVDWADLAEIDISSDASVTA
jgi:dTDP-4-dehydrorhamnose reductase